MEPQTGAATTAAKIKKMGIYIEFIKVIKKAILVAFFWDPHMTDGKAQRKARLIVGQFVTKDLQVPEKFIDMVINSATLAFPDTDRCTNDDLRSCFFVGAVSGYFHPAVFDAPYGLDRLQKDAFMEGVVLGEDAWHNDHEDLIN